MNRSAFETIVLDYHERMEKQSAKQELEAIERDGRHAHALTKLPGTKHGWSSKLCTVDDAVAFAYACWKNAAGYYLSWREDYDHATGTGTRSDFKAWRTRKAATRWAAREADRELERIGESREWEWLYAETDHSTNQSR